MAKRKASRAGRKKAGVSRTAAGRTRAKARKAAPRRTTKATKKTAGARKAASKATAPRAGASARTAVPRKSTRKAVRRAAPKAAPSKTTRRSSPTTGRKQSAPVSRRSPGQAAVKRTATQAKNTVPLRTSTRGQGTPSKFEGRKAPGLDRERRVINDDDIVQSTPPSSLDLDRTASAARSGRRTLVDRYAEHTETGPALTGGDVDADWESAYSVGDEAPGGDNPTPDQDIVDDIGRAVGVEYQDNEELKGADKVAKRDKNRWELDPASSDDWEDR